jgi:tRNA 2-selenouridine synthase SelU
MTEVTPENIKQIVEDATAAYTNAWKVQAEYNDGLVRRNTQALVELADARISSFKEMRDSSTFNQAFEANLAFEEKVREDLVTLQEENTKSWETLVEELTAIYTPAEKAAAAKKPAAKAKKAA